MKKYLWLMILGSCHAWAYNVPACLPLPKATPTFSITNFNACMSALKPCQKTASLYDQLCSTQVAAKTAACATSAAIAQQINMPITTLQFLPIYGYQLITATFLADGQRQYYILSPKACLVNTVDYPAHLNTILINALEQSDFLVVNARPPAAKKSADGSVNFSALLHISDCLACKIIGTATVVYQFDAKGNFSNAHLAKFTR